MALLPSGPAATFATWCNAVQQPLPFVSVTVHNTQYLTLNEVANLVDRHRTTLWRWRQKGKIPTGWRYCDQMLLYTMAEVEQIYAYAHRLEPDEAHRQLQNQLRLFI